MSSHPVALATDEAPPRIRKSNTPAIFAGRIGERIKQPLGDLFGLTVFGVNLTTLKPGAASSLRHAHTKQDEFLYILAGTPTLITDRGEMEMMPGMCAGFKAGAGEAHHLVNRGSRDVVFLEVGDRTAGDRVAYPDDDLEVVESPDGRARVFAHKDGTPY